MRLVEFIAFGLALGLTGCSEKNGDAREAVRRTLNDPESAQFRNEKDCSKRAGLHGEVNWKGESGGYLGFQPFIYIGGAAAVLSRDDPYTFARLQSACY